MSKKYLMSNTGKVIKDIGKFVDDDTMDLFNDENVELLQA
jgi:hypothetical protein